MSREDNFSILKANFTESDIEKMALGLVGHVFLRKKINPLQIYQEHKEAIWDFYYEEADGQNILQFIAELDDSEEVASEELFQAHLVKYFLIKVSEQFEETTHPEDGCEEDDD